MTRHLKSGPAANANVLTSILQCTVEEQLVGGFQKDDARVNPLFSQLAFIQDLSECPGNVDLACSQPIFHCDPEGFVFEEGPDFRSCGEVLEIVPALGKEAADRLGTFVQVAARIGKSKSLHLFL